MIASRYILRDLQRRPGRWLIGLFSVVIAVSAIVAVSSATATTRSAYQQVFENLSGRADLEIVSEGQTHFSQDVAKQVRAMAGVRAVVPVFHRGTIVYANEKKAKGMASGIVVDEPESLAELQVTDGRLPTKPNEVAVQTSLATALEIKTGTQVRLLTSRGLRPHTVVGIVEPESVARLRQGGLLLAPLDHLQRVFRAAGEIDSLQILLAPEADPDSVLKAIARVLPAHVKVQVPAARSGLSEQTLLLANVSLNMASALSFLTAVFIVLSIFLMSVGERRKQLSILRAVGATRKQIIRMVCAEALVTGLVGTMLGIPIGILGGRTLIQSMAALLQTNLPETPDLRWAIGSGLIVGPVACLIAAWYPAYKASLVSPLEGMRPAISVESRKGTFGTSVVAIIGLLIAVLLALASARGNLPIWAAVAGLILSLVSLVLLIPVFLGLVVRALHKPLSWLFGLEGEMSERLVLRRRTRSSLAIGVLFIGVSAAVGTSNAVFSITNDVHTWYERTVTADFLLRPMMPDMSGQEGASMPESLRGELTKLEEVGRVDAVRLLRIEAGGQDAMLMARDFSLYDEAPLDIIAGDPVQVGRELRDGKIVVGSVLAEKTGVHPGDSLKITLGTETHEFPVVAIATEYSFGGSIATIDRSIAKQIFHIEGVDTFLIKARDDRAFALQPKLQAIAEREGLLLQSFVELLQLINSMVAGVTGGLWVLLTLGLAVGTLGVVNTLTMNVLEQTRELGMLRAIGMKRRQVIKLVMGQAVILGAIGIGAGAISGVSLAYSLNQSLASLFGRYVPFVLNFPFLAALVVVGFVVVLVAALFPSWRAARLSPIQAMHYE